MELTGPQRDFAAEMHRLPENRRQLIFRIRRQIAEGTYDTPERLEVAIDRMVDSWDREAEFPVSRN